MSTKNGRKKSSGIKRNTGITKRAIRRGGTSSGGLPGRGCYMPCSCQYVSGMFVGGADKSGHRYGCSYWTGKR